MADPSVADLVVQMRSNMDSIHECIESLSDTKLHDAEMGRLETEREKQIEEIRIKHENGVQQLAEQRKKEEQELVEKRRKEEDELLERRRREDEERKSRNEKEEKDRLARKKEEDVSREMELEEKRKTIHERVEGELEKLEDEMERRVEEGKKILKDLDEKRKAINQQIDTAISKPTVLPTINFRSRRRTRSQFLGWEKLVESERDLALPNSISDIDERDTKSMLGAGPLPRRDTETPAASASVEVKEIPSVQSFSSTEAVLEVSEAGSREEVQHIEAELSSSERKIPGDEAVPALEAHRVSDKIWARDLDNESSSSMDDERDGKLPLHGKLPDSRLVGMERAKTPVANIITVAIEETPAVEKIEGKESAAASQVTGPAEGSLVFVEENPIPAAAVGAKADEPVVQGTSHSVENPLPIEQCMVAEAGPIETPRQLAIQSVEPAHQKVVEDQDSSLEAGLNTDKSPPKTEAANLKTHMDLSVTDPLEEKEPVETSQKDATRPEIAEDTEHPKEIPRLNAELLSTVPTAHMVTVVEENPQKSEIALETGEITNPPENLRKRQENVNDDISSGEPSSEHAFHRAKSPVEGVSKSGDRRPEIKDYAHEDPIYPSIETAVDKEPKHEELDTSAKIPLEKAESHLDLQVLPEVAGEDTRIDSVTHDLNSSEVSDTWGQLEDAKASPEDMNIASQQELSIVPEPVHPDHPVTAHFEIQQPATLEDYPPEEKLKSKHRTAEVQEQILSSYLVQSDICQAEAFDIKKESRADELGEKEKLPLPQHSVHSESTEINHSLEEHKTSEVLLQPGEGIPPNYSKFQDVGFAAAYLPHGKAARTGHDDLPNPGMNSELTTSINKVTTKAVVDQVSHYQPAESPVKVLNSDTFFNHHEDRGEDQIHETKDHGLSAVPGYESCKERTGTPFLFEASPEQHHMRLLENRSPDLSPEGFSENASKYQMDQTPFRPYSSSLASLVDATMLDMHVSRLLTEQEVHHIQVSDNYLDNTLLHHNDQVTGSYTNHEEHYAKDHDVAADFIGQPNEMSLDHPEPIRRSMPALLIQANTVDNVPSFETYPHSDEEDSAPITPSDTTTSPDYQNMHDESVIQPSWSQPTDEIDHHELQQEMKPLASPGRTVLDLYNPQASPLRNGFDLYSPPAYPSYVIPKSDFANFRDQQPDDYSGSNGEESSPGSVSHSPIQSEQSSPLDTSQLQQFPASGPYESSFSSTETLIQAVTNEEIHQPQAYQMASRIPRRATITDRTSTTGTSVSLPSMPINSIFQKTRSLFESPSKEESQSQPLTRPLSTVFTTKRTPPSPPQRSSLKSRTRSVIYFTPPGPTADELLLVPKSLDPNPKPPSPAVIYYKPPGPTSDELLLVPKSLDPNPKPPSPASVIYYKPPVPSADEPVLVPKSLDSNPKPPSPGFVLPPEIAVEVPRPSRRNSIFDGLSKLVASVGLEIPMHNPNTPEKLPLLEEEETQNGF